MAPIARTLGMVLVLLLAGCESPDGGDRAFRIAGEIRAGNLPPETIRRRADEALDKRLTDWCHLRAAWGDVVDAALQSGALDQDRRARAYAEAVVPYWNTATEGYFPGEEHRLLSVVFGPCVGPESRTAYDATITDAAMDGALLQIGEPFDLGYIYHVANPAGGDTMQFITLPGSIRGRTLSFTWRVRIFDKETREPLAEDWIHTETITFPDRPAWISGHRARGVAPAYGS